MLYPIRHVRHPMVQPDAPAATFQPTVTTPLPIASAASTTSENQIPPPIVPIKPSEKFSAPPSPAPDRQPDQLPPSDPIPTNLWLRQPDEPAGDFQLFVKWLQLPSPRRLRAAAVTLGCSPSRLRQLSVRHHWPTRTAAWDNHRAAAASEALEQLVREEADDWHERAKRFRLQEWVLHEEMLQAAHEALHKFKSSSRVASLTELVKLLDLASVLGRRASGLPLDPGAPPAPFTVPPSSYHSTEEALRKIYGDKTIVKPTV